MYIINTYQFSFLKPLASIASEKNKALGFQHFHVGFWRPDGWPGIGPSHEETFLRPSGVIKPTKRSGQQKLQHSNKQEVYWKKSVESFPKRTSTCWSLQQVDGKLSQKKTQQLLMNSGVAKNSFCPTASLGIIPIIRRWRSFTSE